jgi:O-antigen/teichoic acid export membrane protein
MNDLEELPDGGVRTVGTRRVARDTILITLAGVLSKAASLVTVPFLARQLDPSGYGRVDLAYGTAVLLIVLLSFAGDIPAASAHARAADTEGRRTVLRTYVVATLTVSTAAALALMLLAPAIATSIWASPSDTGLAVAMLALVPVKCLQGALANVQRLRGRAGVFAALSSVDLLAQLAFAVGLAAAGFGAIGVIVGYAIGSFVSLAAGAWLGRDVFRGARRIRGALGMVVGGLPYLPPIVAFLFADNIGRVLIAHTLGVGAVGNYGIALRAASAMSLVAGAFSLAWGPLGMSLRRTPESGALFGRMFSTYLNLSILAAIALGSLAPEVTRFLGGADYAGATVAMPGLIFATGTTGALFVLATAAGVNERASAVASTAIVGAVVQVLLSILLVPFVGIAAIAVAALAGRLSNMALLARILVDVVEADWPKIVSMTIIGSGIALMLQYAASASPLAPLRWCLAIIASALAGMVIARALSIRGPWRRDAPTSRPAS